MGRWLPIHRRPGAISRRIPSSWGRDGGAPLAVALSAAIGGGDAGDRAPGPSLQARPDAGARPVSSSAAVRRRLLHARRGRAPGVALDPLARAGWFGAHRGGGLLAVAC